MMKTKPIHPTRMSRRRGQALLLAVLVMIFAALLGASFIAVVSLNLNQTARQSDRTAAVQAASAGIDYVNRQLTYSKDGRQWFKKTYVDSGLLTTFQTQPGYYTPLDKAQNWAGNFVKFPDPLAPGDNGPKFMVRVEDAPASEPDKRGALKVTVVGLSPDDPTAWHSQTFYKGGYLASPMGQVMWAVSNWDFQNNVHPSGEINATGTTSTILQLKNVVGRFPAPPFTVMIGDSVTRQNTPANVPRAVVIGVVNQPVAGTTATLTVSTPGGVTIAPVEGEKVDLAANFGEPTAVTTGTTPGIDFNNDGTVDTDEAADSDFQVSQAGFAGGMRVNGGLFWQGDSFAPNLTPWMSTTGVPATVFCSGAMKLDTASTAKIRDDAGTIATTGASISTDSTDGNFPAATPAEWGTYDAPTRLQMVSDGWNAAKGVLASDRAVPAYSPPNIAKGEGLERYRKLTAGSRSTVIAEPNAAGYGFGEGIYIDNPQDREKVYTNDLNGDGTTGDTGLREMSQSELQNLWNWTGTASAKYHRTQETPATPIASDASLEEQHLRGWVAQDQFLPRGVSIELSNQDLGSGTPCLIVTRDAREDNTSTDTTLAQNPSANKTWRQADGTLLNGVYRRVFPWPTNGVMFAEGNVRIRGTVTNPPRSLTVVSQNNIYIEGSVDLESTVATNTYKLLLLARRNVIVNPTAGFARPDTMTRLSAATSGVVGNLVSVSVEDASDFVKGDFITIGMGLAGVIEGVTVDNNPSTDDTLSVRLTYPYVTAGNAVANDVVRTLLEAENYDTGNRYSKIANSSEAIQRRFQLTGAGPYPNLRVALDHVGSAEIPAFEIATVSSPAHTKPALSAMLSVKRALNVSDAFDPNTSIVTEANQRLRVDYDVPSTPLPTRDTFPKVLPTVAADQFTKTLNYLATDTNEFPSVVHDIDGTSGWQYNVSPVTAYVGLPYFYLAGIGNRYAPGSAVSAINLEQIGNRDSANRFPIPLATSINFWMNGLRATLTNERFDGTQFEQVGQLGFRPVYFASEPAGNPLAAEDVLTVDRTFYQTSVANSTLDSRAVSGVAPGWNSLSMVQNTGGDYQGLPGLNITPTPLLPEYRVRHVKLENLALNAGNPTELNPGITFNIHAFVYAQEGSWFIIPGDYFKPGSLVRGDSTKSYLDLDNSKTATLGEYIDTNGNSTWDDGDCADLNRNGVADPGEKSAVYRYFRYNYAIAFTGSITQNQTPLINDVGSYRGAVKEWTDKWANVTITDLDATTPDVPDVTNSVITYRFDPDIVDGTMNGADGFVLPETPEIIYQS